MKHSFEHVTADTNQERQERSDNSSTKNSNDMLRTTAQEKTPWNDLSSWIKMQVIMDGTQTLFGTLNQVNQHISDISEILKS
jgi:hypothetical protein